MEKIHSAIHNAIEQKKGGILSIAGRPGIGKSRAVEECVEAFEEMISKVWSDVSKRPIVFHRVNCLQFDNTDQLLLNIIESIDKNPAPDSPRWRQSHFHQMVHDEARFKILVLDEFDTLTETDRRGCELFLQTVNEKGSHCMVIVISNSITDVNEIRSNAGSNGHQDIIVFRPYDANQLSAIIKQKIIGFENVIDETAIRFLSRKYETIGGDVRSVMATLEGAIDIAFRASAHQVKIHHVNFMLSQQSSVSVANLPTVAKFIMVAVIQLSKQEQRFFSSVEILHHSKKIKIPRQGSITQETITDALNVLMNAAFIEQKRNGYRIDQNRNIDYIEKCLVQNHKIFENFKD